MNKPIKYRWLAELLPGAIADIAQRCAYRSATEEIEKLGKKGVKLLREAADREQAEDRDEVAGRHDHAKIQIWSAQLLRHLEQPLAALRVLAAGGTPDNGLQKERHQPPGKDR